MEAIERIKGYCTEVTQAQWEELVRVADEVGVNVGPLSRKDGPCNFYHLAEYEDSLSLCREAIGKEIIPFPDFLAKLRGEEWKPKAGEMVEVAIGGRWFKSEVVAFHQGHYICNEQGQWQYLPYKLNQIRPLRPTITRAEAEAQLGKRIID